MSDTKQVLLDALKFHGHRCWASVAGVRAGLVALRELKVSRSGGRQLQLFGGATLWLALLQGIGVLLIVMGAYTWADGRLAEPEARAFAFTTPVIANLALIFSNRSRTRPLLASLRAPNPILWIVTGATLGFLALSLYLPFLAGVFRFASLPLNELAVAFGLGLIGVAGLHFLRLTRAIAKITA